MKIIAVIEDPKVKREILDPMVLPNKKTTSSAGPWTAQPKAELEP